MPILTTLVSFDGTDGGGPSGALIADANGNLFGTTTNGGANGDGSVFEIPLVNGSYASTPTTLISFNGADGGTPDAGLIADAKRDLFGTTFSGGANGNGTVFEIPFVNGSYAGTPSTLISFNGTDGANSPAGLIADANGDLFGTTDLGGANNDGTVFEIPFVNGSYASTPVTLVSFNGTTGPGSSGLIADANGDLFGTTGLGGANNDGTVFEIPFVNGSYASTPVILVSFNDTTGPGNSGLFADANGDLFGTSGAEFSNASAVFEIAKTSAGYASTPTVLASFATPNGDIPLAGVVADTVGDLFGTTYLGGTNGDGTVFEIPLVNGSYASTPTTLVNFDGSNGRYILSGLTADASGHLFGTTAQGGTNGDGTVFELTIPVAPDLTGGFGTVYYTPNGAPVAIDTNIGVTDATSTTLTGATVAIGAGFLADDTLNFTNQNGITGSYNATTGVLTLTGSASLAAYDAAFTGITFSSTSGDPSNSGADPSRTVSWTVTDGTLSSNTVTTTVDINTIPTPTLITLVSFDFTDGSEPEAGVVADAAGDLLGTTNLGGPNGHGTVFEVFKTNGAYASTPTTLLYSAFGTFPTSGLIANTAGEFFGTTSAGGANGFGTAFAFTVDTQNGSVAETTLVSFNKASLSSTEGETPNGGLLMDANGNLFGTTSGGGANNDGTVFELSFVNGSYASAPTTLVSFNGTDGSNPQSALITDANGDLFGTTSSTVFELVNNGGGSYTLTTLASFSNTLQPGASAGLVMDGAGDLFDTTYAGGVNGFGSVFEIAKTSTGYANAPTTLVSFNGTDGATPEAGLIVDAAGNLFGTTSGGGTSDEGTLFEIPFVNGSYASTPTTLVNFNVENGDGAFPAATLFADATGDLFGTTELGGANGDGTVFELTGSGFQVSPLRPVLSGGGNSTTYAPGGAAVTVDAGLGVSDTSSATLAGATVTVGVGFLAGDTLNFTNQNGITGSYNIGTGVLSLTGTSSIANYQSALDSITYGFNSANGDPTGGSGDDARTIDWVVNDGQSTSNQATSAVSIIANQPPVVTANNQSVANGTSVALTSIFSVSGTTPTGYQLFLNSPADGSVTANGTAIPIDQVMSETNLSGLDFIGGAAPGSDQIYLRALNGPQVGSWVIATLTDPGVTPPVVTANNQSVANGTSVALTSIFSVSGTTPTGYQLFLNSPADGSVTANGTAIPIDQVMSETNLSGLDFIGGAAPGSDQIYLRALNGPQVGSWVIATLTDPGVTPPVVTANNQSVANGTSVALTSIFSVSGTTPTGYQLFLNSPADGSVTANGTAIPIDQVMSETNLSGLDFIGGAAPGSDQIYLRALNGPQVGSWVIATLTDPGVTPPVVTANNQSVANGTSVALTSIFSVSGTTPTGYQLFLNSPADGSVTANGTAIPIDQVMSETNLSGLDFIGGAAPGSDQIYLRALNGPQVGSWVIATLTDPGVTPPVVTANNQSVANGTSVALTSIFSVSGTTPTGYQLFLNSPADGSVTANGTAIPIDQVMSETNLSGLDFIGGAAPGSDQIYLRALNGPQVGSWVIATLTDPGVTPPVVTANNQSVANGTSVALTSIFSVSGTTPTGYQLFLNSPADGSVTANGTAIPIDQVMSETNLSGLDFIGGAAPGSDQIYLRALNGPQVGSWVIATLTDPGVTPPVVTANNQSVANGTSVALTSIFSVSGTTPTGYQLFLNSPADGSVTANGTAIPIDQVMSETNLSGLDFIGGAAPGSDQIYLRALNGPQVGSWVIATLTDPGVTPPVVTANNQSVANGTSVALTSIFSVSGTTPTGYQLFLNSPADGSVTANGTAIPIDQVMSETNLSGLDFIGGAAPGSDQIYLRALNGPQVGSWVIATLTDSTTSSGGSDFTLVDTPDVGTTYIFTGATDATFLDEGHVYNDTVVGFDEGAGDRIHLMTDTVADALAHSTQVNGGADTLITLSDSSTILLKGVTHIDTGIFA